jgi:folate-binding protein YgfZ
MHQFEHLSDRIIISCRGVDAQKFLQGITTNDVLQNFFYAAMLSPIGRFLFDFFVYQISPEHYLIDAASEIILDKMLSYKLRNKIELSNVSNEYAILYASTKLDVMSSFYFFPDTRRKGMGIRCILPKMFLSDLDFGDHQQGLYAKAKYENTIPDGELDMVSDKSFPLEFGLSELNGVSYTKGCYLGQENLARTYHTGIIRKHVYRVIALDEEPLSLIAKGSDIVQKDCKVGIFCSGYNNLGIALIRSEDIHLKGTFTLCEKIILIEKAAWYSVGDQIHI